MYKEQAISRGRFFLFSLAAAFALTACGAGEAGQGMERTAAKAGNYRGLTDMRGKEVSLPVSIGRVVTISDGFIAGVMACLGEVEKIVGLGSRCVQQRFHYEFSTADGERYRFDNGMNPVSLLHPTLMDLPLVAASNAALNYETLAGLAPDVVILRAGSCTFGTTEDEKTLKAVQTVEQLGIPVFVLKGPPCYREPELSHLHEEIRLLGLLFGKAEQASALTRKLEESLFMIRARCAGIAEKEKPRLLLLGLSPRARAAGGAGNTKGLDTIESYFIEQIANARNAYRGPGGRSGALVLSAEQIYALAPDAILLPTASGYHPPRELYTAPYFKQLRELEAVRNRRVYALPWSPCNCAKRIEYPIEALIIAKAAYPEKFADIKVRDWVLDFYQDIYQVDESVARQLRAAQWLDWTITEDF